MAFYLDCITYTITAVIVLSVSLKVSRPATLVYSFTMTSVKRTASMSLAGGITSLKLYHSFYGLAIAGMSMYGLLGTRFRLYVYALRFRTLVKDLTTAVSQGSRVIMVLPDDEEQSQLLIQLLDRQMPGGAFQNGTSFWLIDNGSL